MATSVVPALIDALVLAADNALASVQVYDGFGVTADPGDFLMIGVEDPDSDDAAFSADTRQTWANANHTARDEEGDIVCAALSWNGNDNQKAARDAVYATAAAVENLLRANADLDVEGVLWTAFGSSSQLTQTRDGSGALALLVFRVHFRARI